jgi:hypothetical protein
MHDKLIQSVTQADRLDQSQIFDNVYFNALETPEKTLLGILMTPICDIHQKRVAYYKFCPVLPFQFVFFAKLMEDINLTQEQFKAGAFGDKKKDKILQYLERVLNNNFDRFHWLGKLPNQDGYWIVDYQLVETLSKKQFDLIENKRLYKLLAPLRESVLVRYSNYAGRVGLSGEDKERKDFAKKLFDEFKT